MNALAKLRKSEIAAIHATEWMENCYDDYTDQLLSTKVPLYSHSSFQLDGSQLLITIQIIIISCHSDDHLPSHSRELNSQALKWRDLTRWCWNVEIKATRPPHPLPAYHSVFETCSSRCRAEYIQIPKQTHKTALWEKLEEFTKLQIFTTPRWIASIVLFNSPFLASNSHTCS